jgi:hypothetical protein
MASEFRKGASAFVYRTFIFSTDLTNSLKSIKKYQSKLNGKTDMIEYFNMDLSVIIQELDV